MPITVFKFNPLRLEAARKFVHADSSDESHQFHVSMAPLHRQGKKVGKIHFDTKVLQNGSTSAVQADATLMIADEVIRASLLWQAATGNHQIPSCVSDQVLSSTGRKARVTFQAKRLTSVTVTSPPKVLVTSLQYVSTIPDSSATLQNVTVHISDTSAPSNYHYRLYLASGEKLLDDVIDGAESTTLVLNNLQSNVAYKLVVSLSPLFDDFETSTTTFTPQPLDINDLADWDGEKHVLRDSCVIQQGHQLIHGKLHVPKNKTLTVYGNMDSTDTLTVTGTVHIHGQHVTRKEFNVSKNGVYNVHGRSVHKTSDPLKGMTKTTSTETPNKISGYYNIFSGGSSYTQIGVTCINYGSFIIYDGGRYDNLGVLNNFYYINVSGNLNNSGTINNNFYANQETQKTFTTRYGDIHVYGTLMNYNATTANLQNGGKGYLDDDKYIQVSQDGKINNYSPDFAVQGLLKNYPKDGIYANAGSSIDVYGTLDLYAGNINVYSNVLSIITPGVINNKSNITYIDDKQYFGLSYNYQTDDTIYFTIKIDDGSTIYENGIDQDPPNDDTFRINIGDYDDGGLFSHDTHNIQSFIDAYAKKHDNHKTLKLDKTMFGVLTGCHACRVNVLLGTTANIPQPDPRTNDARVYSTSPFIYNAVTSKVVDIFGNVLP
jgi:hypothetical protein